MSSIAERKALANACKSEEWSKAIRILDSIISKSFSAQDLCNRAFCYRQLELHKHTIKDCDKAIELNPTLLQAFILKGCALSSMGKIEDALCVWEHGYGRAASHCTDLKQILELEELLANAKLNGHAVCEEQAMGSSCTVTSSSESDSGSAPKSHRNDQNIEITSAIVNACESVGVMEKNSITIEPHDVGGVVEESSVISTPREGVMEKSSRARVSKTTSVFVDFRLSQGIAEHEDFMTVGVTSNMLEQIKLDRSPRYPVVTNILCQQVNEGNYDQAVSTFEKVLQRNPASPEALVGRGTAYAFQRKLELAIADFTMAIQLDPLAGEAWKRRGQARAALGEIPEAIEDLTKALQFEPKSSDILHERAVKDLSSCVLSDRKNETAYTYLGLALSSLGEYTKAEKALLKSVQIDPKFQEGRTHLSQFYHELAQVEKASKCIQNLISIDNRFAMAYYLHGNLHYGLGDHRSAIKDLSVALSIESSDLESLYLRASSYHAVGDYVEAVKDYDTVIDLKADSMDKFVLQCLAFYQKEIALYTASRVTLEFTVFNIDDDVHPLFKEYWCKRLHPQHVSENVVRQPPLKDALKRGRLKKQDYTFTRQKEILLEAADSIGKRIQYNSPGFLPNRRQYRMAGLAAIDIAQKVSKAWQSLRAEWKSLRRSGAKGNRKNRKSEMGSVASQNRGGAGCSSQSSGSSSSYNPDDDRSLRLRFVISWHDVYSFAVKWRQISEPCDSVVWVNRLSEHKNSAFGSRTSLILGQGKVVRYFPYYQRTLDALKNIMKERAFVNNKANEVVDLTEVKMLQAIVNAECVADLYNIIGQDFWLATTCVSTAFEGKQLEGTRITVEKEDKGFDFAIRTPCTRPRWEDYGAEMTAAWETVCNHYCGEAYGSTDIRMLDNVRDSILRMTYYWYNFMPLSRGSAAVGYVVMLGLFLAANMEVNESIPKGMQVDWEAILSPYPDMFVDSMKAWICPSLKINTSWKELPDVSSAFPTTGLVVAALSTY